MNPEITESIYSEELYEIAGPLTVAINRPWNKLTSDEIVLLGKILGSVKRSLNEVKITHPADLDSLPHSPSNVISFGVKGLPHVPWYQVTRQNGYSIIKADALSELDEPKKKNLWSALRQMFEK